MPSLIDEKNLSGQEGQCNDATISWPTDDMIEKLPSNHWIVEEMILANEKCTPDDLVDNLSHHLTIPLEKGEYQQKRKAISKDNQIVITAIPIK